MINCTICFQSHDNVWDNNEPNMFCKRCETLKRNMKGQYQNIIGSLYLGDIFAGKSFKGDTLCVHENPDYARMHHMPFLSKQPKSPLDRSGALASIKGLNKIADFINEYVEQGKDILVHCKGGVERSPLAVAWYLCSCQNFKNLDEAYQYLIRIRPIVSDRKFWLLNIDI